MQGIYFSYPHVLRVMLISCVVSRAIRKALSTAHGSRSSVYKNIYNGLQNPACRRSVLFLVGKSRECWDGYRGLPCTLSWFHFADSIITVVDVWMCSSLCIVEYVAWIAKVCWTTKSVVQGLRWDRHLDMWKEGVENPLILHLHSRYHL